MEKLVTVSYILDSIHKWNTSSLFFVLILMMMAAHENKKFGISKYWNIIQKCWPSETYVYLCTQNLVGDRFARMTASMWCGMEADQPVALLRLMQTQVALIFRSSALLGLVSLIFLLIMPYRFPIKFRWVGWPIKHSKTMVSKPVTSSFGTVGKC